MEQQVLAILADSQSAVEGPRKQAESQLTQLYTNEAFPISLCAIGSHTSVPLGLRQAALIVLKKFILSSWSTQFSEFQGHVLVNPENKERLRSQLLELSTASNTDRKVKNVASFVVSKIASVDFPDDWPTLLPYLLDLIPKADDGQLQGALRVLNDLVEEGFDDEQFFKVVRDLVKLLFDVAINEEKKFFRRAMALSVFRSCFNTLLIVKEQHPNDVKAFADEVVTQWSPLFVAILKMALPAAPSAEGSTIEGSKAEDEWRGTIALKLQVVKALMKIREVFPSILAPQSPVYFSAIWQELLALQELYYTSYISDDQQNRLVDSDNLPYSLDFLVLEDIDFMQSCLRAPPVKKELEEQLKSQRAAAGGDSASWVNDVMKLMIAYSQITTEEEGLWEIDVNIFLAEETSVTANYTPRTACGDLVIKLCEWIHVETLEGLLKCAQESFSSSSWKAKEACLFILSRLLGDFLDLDRTLAPDFANRFAEYAKFATEQEHVFLRARGFLSVGLLARTSAPVLQHVALAFMDKALKTITTDAVELVKVGCIRALQDYIQALPPEVSKPLQNEILAALTQFVSSGELEDVDDSDDLLITLVETLRDVIFVDQSICIAPGSGALDLLFSLASKGANHFHVTAIVNEAFEVVAIAMANKGGDSFAQLCSKVLPSLTGAFDVASLTDMDALAILAAELMAKLAEHGSEPLPQGFAAAAIPKLTRLLLSSDDAALLRPGTEALRYMLVHDHKQVFDWRDENGKSGLEVCLVVIDRLLGPQVGEIAASEVGELAAELVEKAGSEQLGPFLSQLLTAVAMRLATAEQASLVQSLVSVFARLSMSNAKEVVDFLAQIQMGNESGLQVVMSKWLINSVHFAGYEMIKQNSIAISKIFLLEDPRLAQIMVQGDLIVPTSDRIMTRSRTRTMPDQFTIVPVPVKIIKILVGDLASASGMSSRSIAYGTDLADEDDGDDDDGDSWEDVPAGIDLSTTAAKQDLMSFAEGTGGSFLREQDPETGQYLTAFFSEIAAKNTGGFSDVFNALTPEEQAQLRIV
ncbi:MAG: hypothetical protein M1814_000724 [Vezdaea aestivalis]|nr:MAG: hypothetical protein M1814_000724 [Vezdaea aestivalis]